MQGQSPYLVNAGLFYQQPKNGWNAAILYNRIGKRIIGVGRSWAAQATKYVCPTHMKCHVMPLT